ncbi:hypothetical protein FQA39_LY04104 [Lamprigera yunnana]|nr:hypothetical protein FQA39_LY04104 [Lamprigera yunnana]
MKGVMLRIDSRHFYGRNKYTILVPDNGLVSEDEKLVFGETDDESSEEDNVPLAVLVKNKKTTNRHRDNFTFTGEVELSPNTQEVESLADFLLLLFTDDLISMIVEQSNLKAIQDNANKPAKITKEEKEQFFGIIIFMRIDNLGFPLVPQIT